MIGPFTIVPSTTGPDLSRTVLFGNSIHNQWAYIRPNHRLCSAMHRLIHTPYARRAFQPSPSNMGKSDSLKLHAFGLTWTTSIKLALSHSVRRHLSSPRRTSLADRYLLLVGYGRPLPPSSKWLSSNLGRVQTPLVLYHGKPIWLLRRRPGCIKWRRRIQPEVSRLSDISALYGQGEGESRDRPSMNVAASHSVN